MWPEARIQRCIFHAANQVKRCTALNPRLDAGIELLCIANRLKDAGDADSARGWLLEYNAWCTRWDKFLKEFTIKDGKRVWTHERFRKARRGLNRLVKDGMPFTFVEILRVMPTDDDVEGLFKDAPGKRKRDDGGLEEYGSGIVWSEFHMSTEYKC